MSSSRYGSSPPEAAHPGTGRHSRPVAAPVEFVLDAHCFEKHMAVANPVMPAARSFSAARVAEATTAEERFSQPGHRLPEAAGDGEALLGLGHQVERQAGDAPQLVVDSFAGDGQRLARVPRTHGAQIGDRADVEHGQLFSGLSADAPHLADRDRREQAVAHPASLRPQTPKLSSIAFLAAWLASFANVLVGPMPTQVGMPVQRWTVERISLA